MSWALQLVPALSIFLAGGAAGIKYHVGVVAQRDLAAAEAVHSDQVQQRRFNDTAAGKHAAAVDRLSNQLGNAREKIASLSSRECLDAGTVGVLNAIGVQPGGAAASQPSTATGTFATAKDVGAEIAGCRAGYAKLSSQLNEILDIEDRRHPAAP